MFPYSQESVLNVLALKLPQVLGEMEQWAWDFKRTDQKPDSQPQHSLPSSLQNAVSTLRESFPNTGSACQKGNWHFFSQSDVCQCSKLDGCLRDIHKHGPIRTGGRFGAGEEWETQWKDFQSYHLASRAGVIYCHACHSSRKSWAGSSLLAHSKKVAYKVRGPWPVDISLEQTTRREKNEVWLGLVFPQGEM